VDNLTHSLFALTLARTPLRRAGRGTTLTLLLASNAPDSDFVAAITHGGGGYITAHRASSHGPLGVAVLAVVAAGLVYAGLAWRRRSHRGRAEPGPDAGDATWAGLVAVSLIGTLGHVLMDLPTSYGTRSFSPFDDTWYAIDLVPIIDVYLLAVLAAGLAATRVLRAHQGRIAAIVLMLMLANYGLRIGTHQRALDLAGDGRTPTPMLSRWPDAPYPKLPGDFPCAAPPCALRLAALPTFGSPFVWRIVRQFSNGYKIAEIDVRSGLAARARWEPHETDPAVFAARQTQTSRQLLTFSRFPAARVERRGEDTLVRISDVRFLDRPVPGRGEAPGSPGLFGVVVRLDARGRVIADRFGN
jgi:membrane-bound metal-dependent hydrolase YbcI (DUF457 family)